MSIYIISGILLILILFRQIKNNFILYSIGTLPATFFHELTHLFTSLFLNGRPVSFSIFPKRVEKNDSVFYELGSVGSANITWYNGIFIGLSPFFLWIFAYYLFLSISGSPISTINIIKMITIAMFIEGGLPSIPDFKIAASKSYVYILLIAGALMMYQDIFPIILDKMLLLDNTIRGFIK